MTNQEQTEAIQLLKDKLDQTPPRHRVRKMVNGKPVFHMEPNPLYVHFQAQLAELEQASQD